MVSPCTANASADGMPSSIVMTEPLKKMTPAAGVADKGVETGTGDSVGTAVGAGGAMVVGRSVGVVVGAESRTVTVGFGDDPELQPRSRHVAVINNQRQNVSMIDTSHVSFDRRSRSQSMAWAASSAWSGNRSFVLCTRSLVMMAGMIHGPDNWQLLAHT